MEKRFKVLRFVGTLYKIFGVVVGVAMLILALGICAVSVMGGASMADYAREYGMRGMEVFGALGGVIYRWLSEEPAGVVAGVKTA